MVKRLAEAYDHSKTECFSACSKMAHFTLVMQPLMAMIDAPFHQWMSVISTWDGLDLSVTPMRDMLNDMEPHSLHSHNAKCARLWNDLQGGGDNLLLPTIHFMPLKGEQKLKCFVPPSNGETPAAPPSRMGIRYWMFKWQRRKEGSSRSNSCPLHLSLDVRTRLADMQGSCYPRHLVHFVLPFLFVSCRPWKDSDMSVFFFLLVHLCFRCHLWPVLYGYRVCFMS